jgi:lipopolysaccharide biosynthesis regulator YciM
VLFVALLALKSHAPQALPLAAGLLAKLAADTGRQGEARQLLSQSYEAAPSIDLVDALIKLEADPQAARQRYVQHLQREPSLIAAGKWLAGEVARVRPDGSFDVDYEDGMQEASVPPDCIRLTHNNGGGGGSVLPVLA